MSDEERNWGQNVTDSKDQVFWSEQTYTQSSDAFRPLGPRPLAHVFLDPAHEVPEGFGTGDDVEGRRQSSPFLKVTHPQFCPGKFPLDVCVILKARAQHMKSTPTIISSSCWCVDLPSQRCAGTSCSSSRWACWGAPPARWCYRCRTWWHPRTPWTDGPHPRWSRTGWWVRRWTRRETAGSQITCRRKFTVCERSITTVGRASLRGDGFSLSRFP